MDGFKTRLNIAITLFAAMTIVMMCRSIAELTGVDEIGYTGKIYGLIMGVVYNLSNRIPEWVPFLIIFAWAYIWTNLREHFVRDRILLAIYIFVPLILLLQIDNMSFHIALASIGVYVGIAIAKNYHNTILLGISIIVDEIISAIHYYYEDNSMMSVWLEIATTVATLAMCYAVWRYFKFAPMYAVSSEVGEESVVTPEKDGKKFSVVVYVVYGLLSLGIIILGIFASILDIE